MAEYTTKQKAVLAIQMQYYYEHGSMTKAVDQANADWQKKQGIASKKMSTKQKADQIKLGKELEAIRKADNVRMLANMSSTYAKSEAVTRAHVGKMGQIFRSLSGVVTNSFKRVGTLLQYGGAMAIIAGITSAISGAISSFVDMEKAFTNMAAKTNMSNKELQLTSQVIMEVAEATQFTTVAITEAATALGKLGFTAHEVRQMLPGVANTAAATGESLDKVAKSMGAVMNAFGLDASRSGSVGDRMTQAFRSSALDLDKFATAFNYVGAAAASTGTGIDEVTAAMSVLADRGVTASKMGTGLRKIFVRLAEEGMSLGDVIQQMSEDNITFSDSVALVGQIGATQLKILADNYDEFQGSLGEANNAFGASMIAAAKQQETVAATWLRIKNTYANFFAPDISGESDGWSIDSWSWIKRIQDDFELLTAQVADDLEGSEDRVEAHYERLAKLFWGQEGFREAMERELAKGTDIREWLREQFEKRGVQYDSALMDDMFFDAIDRGVENFNAEAAADRLISAEERAVREVTKIFNKKRENEGIDAANSYAQQASLGFKWGSKEKGDVLGLILEKDVAKYQDTQVELYKSMKGMQKKFEDLDADERNSWFRRDADMKKITAELCKNSPAAYLAFHQIPCPETKSGRRDSKRESFSQDFGDEEAFLKRRGELETEYGLTTDPIEKDRINKELLDLEQGFYASRLMLIQDFVDDQDAILADANLSDSDREDYEANKTSGQKAGLATTKKKEQSLVDRLTKEHKIKQKAYKATQVDAAEHNAIMKKLDSEYDLAQTPELKEQKLEEKRVAVALYYDRQLQLQKQYLADAKKNVADAFGTDVDVSDSQAIIDNFEAVQATTMAARSYTFGRIDKDESGDEKSQEEIDADNKAKAIKNAKAAVEIAAAMADIYKDIAQDRLDIIQEQYDREVELLEDKYAKEKEVRDSAVASGIISQEDAARAEILSERKKNIKMNRMAEKLFEQKKKATIEALIIDGIIGAAMAAVSMLGQGLPWAAPVMAGLALAASGVAVAAEKRKKYVPQVFAEGGMVNGPSHAQGGVPFSVAGHGGYEMEGGEYIVNKQAVKDNFDLLESINGKVNTSPTYFAAGGYVPTASNTAGTDLNVAMLEALNRPVRAYVTDQDLSTSESERRALETKSTY